MSFDITAKFIDQFSQPLQQGVNKASGSVQNLEKKSGTAAGNMGKAFKSAASFLAPLGIAAGATLAVKKVIDITKETATYRDEITKMSRATGVSVDVLSGLGFAAERSGANIDSVGKAFGRLARNIDEASRVEGAAREAFSQLGVQFDDGSGKLRGLYDVLLDTADAFTKIDDSTRKAAIAQELFGRSGVELVPLLEEGKDGISALIQEAERLGITFDQAAGEQAEKAVDAMTNFNTAVQGLEQQLATGLIPLLTAAASAGAEFVVWIQEFNKQTKPISDFFISINPLVGLYVDKIAELLDNQPRGIEGTYQKAREEVDNLNSSLDQLLSRLDKLTSGPGPRPDVPNVPVEQVPTGSLPGSGLFVPVPEVPTELPEDIRTIRDYLVEIGDYTDEWNDSIVAARDSLTDTGNTAIAVSQGVNLIGGALTAAYFGAGDLSDALDKILDQLERAAVGGLFGLVLGGLIGSAFGNPLLGAKLGFQAGSGIQLPGREHGGPVQSGRAYRVGEGGPEVFIPGQSGTIIPNSGQDRPIVVNIYNYGNAMTQSDIEQKLIPAISRGVKLGNAELTATSVRS